MEQNNNKDQANENLKELPFTPATDLGKDGLHNEDKPIKSDDKSIKSLSLSEEDISNKFKELFEKSNHKRHLSKLSKEYSGLIINSVDDKEIYDKILKGISVVRPLRTGLDRVEKTLTEAAKKYIKDVKKGKEVFAREVAKVEDHLWVEREKYEKLLKEKEDSDRIDKEKKKTDRISELSKNGASFDDSFWSINDIHIGVLEIENFDDEKWVDLIGKVKVQNELNIKADNDRIEKDNLTKERFDRIKLLLSYITEDISKCGDWDEEKFNKIYNEATALKEKADKEAAEIKTQIKDLRISQLEMFVDTITDEHKKQIENSTSEEWKSIIDAYKQAKKEKDQADKDRITLAENSKPFQEIGFRHNYTTGDWEISIEKGWEKGSYQRKITKDEMLSPKEGLLQEINELINGWKKEMNEKEEEARLNKIFGSRRVSLLDLGFIINQEGEFVNTDIESSLSKEKCKELSDEDFNNLSENFKKLKDAFDKKKREELLSDNDNLIEYMESLLAINPPEFKNDTAKDKANSIKKFIEKILTSVKSN